MLVRARNDNEGKVSVALGHPCLFWDRLTIVRALLGRTLSPSCVVPRGDSATTAGLGRVASWGHDTGTEQRSRDGLQGMKGFSGKSPSPALCGVNRSCPSVLSGGTAAPRGELQDTFPFLYHPATAASRCPRR